MHSKILPVVRYLESLQSGRADLMFRYVGPNEMNGETEELQVFLAESGSETGVTIRYQASADQYFIDGPRGGRTLRVDRNSVLSSLEDVLEQYLPSAEHRNAREG